MGVLTDAKARAIKPEGKDLPDGTVKGLWLKPTAKKGRGQWIFRYVSPVTTERRDMGLGAYPDVGCAHAFQALHVRTVQDAAHSSTIFSLTLDRCSAARF